MKREILFRGARVCDGHFVNGSLVEVNGECDSNESVPHIVISYGPDTFDWFEVEPETVGQFTGMTDKNGTKIFEGDIVCFGSKYGSISDVKYIGNNAGFLIKDRWGDWNWLYNVVKSTNCEVIGNIYDNKELLK